MTHACQGQVVVAQAYVRRGPSADDLDVTTFNTASPKFMIVARADDVNVAGQVWLGFYLNGASQQLSWIVEKVGTTTFVTKTGVDCSRLPTHIILPDSNWGDVLTGQTPFNPVDNLRTAQIPYFRGFGMSSSQDYPSIASCQHPGFDFPATANTTVRAMYGGIVVGMGKSGSQDRPAAWGATIGGYNLVIRSGGHFVLYGHLSSIHPSLYYGKRVTAGAEIGTLADQGANTHLHIQVSAFNTQQNADNSLRPHYGAIRRSTGIGIPDLTRNPILAIDVVYFIPPNLRGNVSNSAMGTNSSCLTGNQDYQYTILNSATFGVSPFGYNMRDSVKLQCFNLSNGSIHAGSSCLSKHP
jgi:hypothetical protein